LSCPKNAPYAKQTWVKIAPSVASGQKSLDPKDCNDSRSAHREPPAAADGFPRTLGQSRPTGRSNHTLLSSLLDSKEKKRDLSVACFTAELSSVPAKLSPVLETRAGKKLFFSAPKVQNMHEKVGDRGIGRT
jgi:hypothetical protein